MISVMALALLIPIVHKLRGFLFNFFAIDYANIFTGIFIHKVLNSCFSFHVRDVR